MLPVEYGVATDPTAPDAAQRSLTGYREVAGFYSPTQNRYFYYPEGDQTKPAKVAPIGFLQGKLANIFQVEQVDDAGRTKIVIKGGPNQGKSFFSKIQVETPVDPNDLSKGVMLKEIPTPPNPYAAVPMKIRTVRGANGVTRKVIEGDPISRTVPRSQIPPEEFSARQINERQRRVVAFASLLRQSEDVLAAIPNVIGPMNSVKSFMTNWVAPLIPGGKDDFGVFVKTAAGQQVFENFARSVRLALTLSPRFPVAEQKVTATMAIDQYNKDGDHQRFFKSMFGTMTKFHEFVRFSANELSRERAQLLGTPWQERMRVPTGSKDDPFNFETRGHLAYLMKAKGIAASPNGFGVFMSARAKTVQEKMYPNASAAQLRKIGIYPDTKPDDLITFKINSNELGSP